MSRQLKPDPRSFYLAGTSGAGARTFNTNQVGAEVKLLKEPMNNYDSKAVAVYLDGVKIGYAPRPLNQFLWFLVEGSTFIVSEWDLDNVDHPDYPLIQVRMDRPEQ